MIAWRIRKLVETASTNEDARTAIMAGEIDRFVVWAQSQTGGKGRHGRSWDSPPGNLYCSATLHPGVPQAQFGFYSFIAALALADSVATYLPENDVRLKWPNDVLVGNKKISGILIESEGPALIIGMGLNVAHCPKNTLFPSTSLQAEGAGTVVLEALLETILQRVDYWSERLQREQFEPIRQAWLDRAVSGRMRVRLPDETIEGEFEALTENGSLVLRLDNGASRVISSGDVFPMNGT